MSAPPSSRSVEEAATRAQLFLAERAFLAASVAVWEEIDRLTDEHGGKYPGLPQSTDIRKKERAAWEHYRDLRAALSPSVPAREREEQ